MSTIGEQVIGAGVMVTIAGEERRLLFDLPALQKVEEEFDGLMNFTQALNASFRGKHLKALRVALIAAGGMSGAAADVLLGRLVGRTDFAQQVTKANQGVSEAFNQAIPAAPRGRTASKASGREKGSPGPSSTAARSSSSSSRRASSAA